MKIFFIALIISVMLALVSECDPAPAPSPTFGRGGRGLIGLLGAAAFGAAALGVASAFIGGGGFFLGKRSANEEETVGEALKLFDLAMEFDSDFCLPEVICEAASKGQKAGSKFEKASVKFADDVILKTKLDFRPETFGEVVLYGAILGRRAEQSEICRKEFSSCKKSNFLKKNISKLYEDMEEEASKE